jgi:hypothetical protein
MSKFQNIIDSFSIQKTLNPKVWENPETPDKSKMIPKVRKALMRISEKFIDYLGDDIFVEDVVLTGSLSNFNWSEYSDFDLHVYVDLNQYGKQSDLYKELFNLKKQVFNKNHDIKIFKYDVELYAQDTEEEHVSSGVYSVMNDEWINKPKKVKTDINKKILEKKIKSWTDKIDRALESSTDEKTLENLKEKLKEYRKSGLESEGELSYENLVFKFLRRSGHIEKLFNTADRVVDKELSVERKLEENEDKSEDKSINYLKIVNSSPFLKSFKEMTDEARSYEFTPGIKIPYSNDVEVIQTALQFLGFSLPKWGIDGKFGPETEKSVTSFQKEFNIPIIGTIKNNDLRHMLAGLVINNFEDSDLTNLTKKREFNVNGVNDENFYKKILELLGAPVSNENMKFLYAWRQSEGKAGKYNPFNTTWDLPGSTNFNKAGVKNYQSIEDGLSATLKTLIKPTYSCITNGLKNDIGASSIAKCESLSTWGSGDLVGKVIKGYESGSSPKISSL